MMAAILEFSESQKRRHEEDLETVRKQVQDEQAKLKRKLEALQLSVREFEGKGGPGTTR